MLNSSLRIRVKVACNHLGDAPDFYVAKDLISNENARQSIFTKRLDYAEFIEKTG